MARKSSLRFSAVLVVGLLLSGTATVAAEEKAKESGVIDQVGNSVKRLAEKIGQEATGAVKKLEQSETPKKVGNELKRSAESLGSKVEQAGKKLKDSFKSE